MTFDAILAQVLDLLQHQGRVAYRALKVRFNLDDDYLEHTGTEEPVYVLKHVLTQEVAYGSILHERRASSTSGSWRPSRRCMPTGWPSRWNGWPAMRSGARCGTRQQHTTGRPEQRRLHARLSERRWCVSSRRWLP